MASAGPRYFGFVIGGALPAALAADWLTSAWDQNAGLHAMSPAAAASPRRSPAGWVLDLLGLPAGCGFGFVTGAQMANFSASPRPATRCCASRLGRRGARAFAGAPAVRVIAGEEAHSTVFRSSSRRLLGSWLATPP